MALSLVLASSCRGGEHAEPKLDFPSRVRPPVRAHGVEDVVIIREHCRDIEAELRERWGVPRDVDANEVRWADRETKWVADLINNGSGCQLRFTNARYFGEPGQPPRALTGIRTGATREEARRIAPALADARSAIDLPGIAGARHAITYDYRTDRVDNLYLILPSRAVEALVMAWGPGPMWIVPATSTAARLEPLVLDDTILRFRQYIPFEQWLGDGTSIAVLPADLWTLDFPAFAKAHPELHPEIERPYSIALPPTESRPFDHIVASVKLDDANYVVEMSFSFSYQTLTMRDAILAQLDRKWGPRKQTDSRWTFERARGVSAIDQLGMIIVYMTRPR